ncbi:MAG: TetR/AcrR family transcriptional regulator [Gemmatimonadaceae bacterium]
MRRRQPRTDGVDTRQDILEAARDLFAARGVDRVTMRVLARAIRRTPATIYIHFKDKSALLRELVEQDFHALSGRFARLADIADPVERLREMAHVYIEFGVSYPNHYQLLFMTPHPGPVARAGRGVVRLGSGTPEQDAYALLMHTVADCIAAGRFREEFRSAESVAQMLWAALHGVVSLHIAKGNDPWIAWKAPTGTASLLVDALTRGLLVPAAEA